MFFVTNDQALTLAAGLVLRIVREMHKDANGEVIRELSALLWVLNQKSVRFLNLEHSRSESWTESSNRRYSRIYIYLWECAFTVRKGRGSLSIVYGAMKILYSVFMDIGFPNPPIYLPLFWQQLKRAMVFVSDGVWWMRATKLKFIIWLEEQPDSRL